MEDDEDTIKLQSTFKDLERSNVRGIDIQIYIDMLDNRRNKAFLSDIENFVINVNNIGKELVDNNILINDDLEILLNSIAKINKPQHKNATAYILGYIATDKGRELTIDNFKKAFNLIKKSKKYKYTMDDTSVQTPDIIRYARLWLKL
jgi:hypothetical protein